MLATSPFQLPVPSWLKFLQPLLERILGLSYLDRLYRQRVHTDAPKDFVKIVLKQLGLRYTVESDIFDAVPADGPLVVVANHPFGFAEGLAIVDMLLKVRPDTRVLANQLLDGIPEVRELLISVDIFSVQGRKANQEAVMCARKWVEAGGVLLIFPAGEVAKWSWKKRRVMEAPWRTTGAKIIRETKASVLSVFVVGNNSRFFHILGLLHPVFRTLSLVRELINKRGQVIHLSLGDLMTHSEICQIGNNKVVTHFLRLNTLLLRKHVENRQSARRLRKSSVNQSLLEPVLSSLLLDDVRQLPASRCLLVKGDMEVWCAEASELPHVLQEIGRLRELTFREVGEGTGYEVDIDQYDHDYLHMFLWHRTRQNIVGAYRLGQVDRLCEKQGISGIYSHSLFQYDAAFLSQLGNCLEMGRSFICPEYQKSLTALPLLWKGIGAFLINNPQYRVLFGPVSISNDYSQLSRQLMANCLQANNYDKTLANLVRPISPLVEDPRAFWDPDHLVGLSHIAGLSLLVKTIEKDKGMPILLKHYLRLQGEFAGFNVDKTFNNALDGLIVVDLRKLNDRMLRKYLGSEGMVSFRASHGRVAA